MTHSIRAKLFLTLLLACVLVLIGTQAFMHWSLERGLVELVDAREQARLEQIATRLIESYQERGSWQVLRDDPWRWISAISGRSTPHSPHRRPLRGELESGQWPPPHALERVRHHDRPTPLELRLMLLDGNGDIVYGRPELLETARRMPLRLNGTTIGHLAVLPGRPVAELAELRFRARQGDRLWLIALAMLALSAALAYPLSRRLVRPVRALQETARRLAAGDFSARAQPRGSDEIARLGRDINALAAALERNEQARRQWVADISHELRTPIALLRAQLEAIQDGVRPFDTDTLDQLHADALRLGRLVDDLYELTTTDLGALGYRFEETDPIDLLRTDCDAFRARYQSAGLDLGLVVSPPGQITLVADAQRLSQLFRNLLANSLQYTDRGGRLEIRATRTPTGLTIDLQDTAPGVPEAQCSRLFERLYRVDDSRNRHTGGAGLGLAIADNVVHAHGGTISARPSPLGGLWIHIELPSDPRQQHDR
ncbi:ATP-binding protein [Marichromatium bheemlicum]|uniref:histidine kinase n=1 Tax=Marichromatium bheemlicum TaxID=365339 RepID=A0ABX1IED9_9GAMM|nr:ATP-binding protein [Marichromatium bheemlicum]NKN34431.1 HAMP domain-containing protein [Marichromatium bheemlicum]